MGVQTFLFIYVLGGLTFVPVVLMCWLLCHHLFGPNSAVEQRFSKSSLSSSASSSRLNFEPDKKQVKFGGLTDLTIVVSQAYGLRESPSKTIPRKEEQSASNKAGKPQPPKTYHCVGRARINHHHLELYQIDTDEPKLLQQFHLGFFNIDFYGEIRGQDGKMASQNPVSESDLFVKRSVIRMTSRRPVTKQRALMGDKGVYYISIENGSLKEDFYHALLEAHSSALALSLKHPESLLQKLAVEQYWIDDLKSNLTTGTDSKMDDCVNALVGRLYLSFRQTGLLAEVLKEKLESKLNRQPPEFLNHVTITDLKLGPHAPMVRNFKLDSFSDTAEIGFSMDIVSKCTIELRLGGKWRSPMPTFLGGFSVPLALKEISGRLLVRVKAPPSNRVWIAFEEKPEVKLESPSLWPIPAKLQKNAFNLLSGYILSQVVVLPNWDDTPFFDTIGTLFRGGMWRDPEAMAEQLSTTYPTYLTSTGTFGPALSPVSNASTEPASPTPPPSSPELEEQAPGSASSTLFSAFPHPSPPVEPAEKLKPKRSQTWASVLGALAAARRSSRSKPSGKAQPELKRPSRQNTDSTSLASTGSDVTAPGLQLTLSQLG